MFKALGQLIGNVVETAANVVAIPANIVNNVVVEPIKDATQAVKEMTE